MTFFKQTIFAVPLHNETVLLRVDYNVPLSADGKIDDDFRIRSSLPTIKKLLEWNCKVVVIAHLGRPEGRDPKLSLEPAAQRLAELLGEDVRFVDQTIGDKPRMAVKRAPMRSVIVLENLRYHPEEEANDENFAHELAVVSGAKYFVQDGFGVVHRAHASTAAITLFLPSVAGLLLERECTVITSVMNAPKHPLVSVLGGAKVADKIAVIKAFINVADKIIIGGAMANTFLSYKGFNMGNSKLDPDEHALIDEIYAAANEKVGAENVAGFIDLPTDLAVATAIDASAESHIVAADQLGPDDIALDIGSQSIETIASVIAPASTVVWNGTLGYAELPNFATSSAALASQLANNTAITSVIGGGDTADFVLKWEKSHDTQNAFTHISTGGGASLELMAGEKLPGIESLLDASSSAK